MDKISRNQLMTEHGLQRGWYRGGKTPADSGWYSLDRDYAKKYAKGYFREYALPDKMLNMNGAVPESILKDVAKSADEAGDSLIAKEIRSAIDDSEPLSYSELNMWFDNSEMTSVSQHFKKAGVEAVTDGKDALILNDVRIRDAKKAGYNPDKRKDLLWV